MADTNGRVEPGSACYGCVVDTCPSWRPSKPKEPASELEQWKERALKAEAKLDILLGQDIVKGLLELQKHYGTPHIVAVITD